MKAWIEPRNECIDIKRERSTMEIGLEVSEMELESKYGLTAQNT